ncbi:hypothetical protein B5X24_HaOG215771 [Helicoverpa armigera]|uniref:Major facilitator superfamily (MFS) profile domain-containing protein n=1 Tax=Helicoverpa armigera TaxID=29058 RepID=A0A2W1B8E1_HELAM|nr:hypothetical protein B5X24_HaOG215771 [Helicoverpa armigera]
MTGIGGGLSTTPGIVIVSQYFDKHRALANGICVSGTAAGSFVFPMLIEKLVDMYGLHGTVLLLGGGMLHVCVSATLYRPAPVSFNTISLADRTPATTTTTENTTLLHNIQEVSRQATIVSRCTASIDTFNETTDIGDTRQSGIIEMGMGIHKKDGNGNSKNQWEWEII